MSKCRLWLQIAWAALSSRSNQVFYDRIASIYDQVFVDHRVHALAITEELFRLYSTKEKDTRVLDLGCGTGMMSTLLADSGFSVFGLDVSLESLKLLHQKKTNMPVLQADAEYLPIADGSLTAVVCLGVWRHFADPLKVLSEISRVLSGDGVVVIGYFPPAIAGAIHLQKGIGKGLVTFFYHLLIRKLGYVDRVDLLLEEETIKAVRKSYVRVDKICSGGHWHLIFAKYPIRESITSDANF